MENISFTIQCVKRSPDKKKYLGFLVEQKEVLYELDWYGGGDKKFVLPN
jgi:hypothetical protein